MRGVPLTLALQLDPAHGTSTAYRGLAWSMKDSGSLHVRCTYQVLVTFSSYVGLVGYCFLVPPLYGLTLALDGF